MSKSLKNSRNEGCCKSKSLHNITGAEAVSAADGSITNFIASVQQQQNIVTVGGGGGEIEDPLIRDTIQANILLRAANDLIAANLFAGTGEIGLIKLEGNVISSGANIVLQPFNNSNPELTNVTIDKNLIVQGDYTRLNTTETQITAKVPVIGFLAGDIGDGVIDDDCDRGWEFNWPEDVGGGSFVKQVGFQGYNKNTTAATQRFVFWDRAEQPDPLVQNYERTSVTPNEVEIDLLYTNFVISEDITGSGNTDLVISTPTLLQVVAEEEDHNVGSTLKYDVDISEEHVVGTGAVGTGTWSTHTFLDPTKNIIELTSDKLDLKNSDVINIETCVGGGGGINLISEDTIDLDAIEAIIVDSEMSEIRFSAETNLLGDTESGYIEFKSGSGAPTTLNPTPSAGDFDVKAEDDITMQATDDIALESGDNITLESGDNITLEAVDIITLEAGAGDYVKITPTLRVDEIESCTPGTGTIIIGDDVCIEAPFTLFVDTIREKSTTGITIQGGENTEQDGQIVIRAEAFGDAAPATAASAGDIWVSAANEIQVRAEGNMLLRSVTGDIDIETLGGNENIRLETADGEITLESNGSGEHIQLNSVDAGVSIQANDTGIALPATVDGSVAINAGVTAAAGVCGSYVPATSGLIKLNAEDSVIIDPKLEVNEIEACSGTEIMVNDDICLNGILFVDTIREKTDASGFGTGGITIQAGDGTGAGTDDGYIRILSQSGTANAPMTTSCLTLGLNDTLISSIDQLAILANEDICIDAQGTGNITLQTTDGDITVDANGTNENVEISTADGHIDLIGRSTGVIPRNSELGGQEDGGIYLRAADNIELLAGRALPNATDNSGTILIGAETEDDPMCPFTGDGGVVVEGDIYINTASTAPAMPSARTKANTNKIELNAPIVMVKEGIEFATLSSPSITDNPGIAKQQTLWIDEFAMAGITNYKLKKQVRGGLIDGGVNDDRPFLMGYKEGDPEGGSAPVNMAIAFFHGTNGHIIRDSAATITPTGDIDTNGGSIITDGGDINAVSGDITTTGILTACNIANDVGANKLIFGNVNHDLNQTAGSDATSNGQMIWWDEDDDRFELTNIPTDCQFLKFIEGPAIDPHVQWVDLLSCFDIYDSGTLPAMGPKLLFPAGPAGAPPVWLAIIFDAPHVPIASPYAIALPGSDVTLRSGKYLITARVSTFQLLNAPPASTTETALILMRLFNVTAGTAIMGTSGLLYNSITTDAVPQIIDQQIGTATVTFILDIAAMTTIRVEVQRIHIPPFPPPIMPDFDIYQYIDLTAMGMGGSSLTIIQLP